MAWKTIILIPVILFILSFNLYGNSSLSKVDQLYEKLRKVVDSYPDSALQIANEIYRTASISNDQRGISMAYMQFGYISALKGRADSAKLFYKKALEIRKKNNLEEETVSTYYQLSILYNDLAIKDSAFYFLFEALRWDKISNAKKYSGRIYAYLGRLFMDYNDSLQAVNYLKKGIGISRQLKDTFGLITGYTELGNYHFQKDRFDSALYYFKLCEKLALSSSNENILADAYNNIALCHSATGNIELAIYYYRHALKNYISKERISDVALVYLNLGGLFLDIQKIDSSLHYLEAGMNMARKTGELNILLKCLEYAADAYAEKGNYFKAFSYHVEYGRLSDSLLNNEKISQIAEMQTKYETEKKEQEISLLNERSKTRFAQRNFFIAGSAVLLMLLLASGVYFLQKQKLARKNAEIAKQKIATLLNEQEIKSYNAMIEGQEEERKRISGDLHDGLGSLLSTVKLLFGTLEDKVGRFQDENKKQFENVNHLIDEAVSEVRKISHDLSTGMVMSFGLVPAINELCDSINSSGLMKCKLLAYGIEERLETQKEIGIYRMVQELISNILKHANATRIVIQLNYSDSSLNVTVEDNGIGFDVAARRRDGGLGLKNLEARAEKIGGVYHVDSRPGAGTISIIEVPV